MDLNRCNVPQLMGIPGIQKSLAESILRYRHSQADRQFHNLNELWKVEGMNRPIFQTLERHFKHSTRHGDRESLPRTAHIGLATGVVCKGQSVPSRTVGGRHTVIANKDAGRYPGMRTKECGYYPTNPNTPTGRFDRSPVKSGRRAWIPTKVRTRAIPVVTESNSNVKDYDNSRSPIKQPLPNTKSTVNVRENVRSNKKSTATDGPLTPPQKEIDQTEAILNGHQNILGRNQVIDRNRPTGRFSRPTQGNVPSRCKSSNLRGRSEDKDAVTLKDSKQPFRLNLSTSGNKMNATCTTDKHLLDNSRSHVSLSGQETAAIPYQAGNARESKSNVRPANMGSVLVTDHSLGIRQCEITNRVPYSLAETPPWKRSLLPENMAQIISNNIDDPECRSGRDMGRDAQATSDYSTFHESMSESGKGTVGSTVVQSLTKENLKQFDSLHGAMMKDRSHNVIAWAEVVNEGRCIPSRSDLVPDKVWLASPHFRKAMADQLCAAQPVTEIQVETMAQPRASRQPRTQHWRGSNVLRRPRTNESSPTLGQNRPGTAVSGNKKISAVLHLQTVKEYVHEEPAAPANTEIGKTAKFTRHCTISSAANRRMALSKSARPSPKKSVCDTNTGRPNTAGVVLQGGSIGLTRRSNKRETPMIERAWVENQDSTQSNIQRKPRPSDKWSLQQSASVPSPPRKLTR